MSIFVKDMETGKETSILTGDETFRYYVLDWWLDDTRFIFKKANGDGRTDYGICTVDGKIALPEPLEDITVLQHTV